MSRPSCGNTTIDIAILTFRFIPVSTLTGGALSSHIKFSSQSHALESSEAIFEDDWSVIFPKYGDQVDEALRTTTRPLELNSRLALFQETSCCFDVGRN